jgi:hypothetical protein
MDICLPLPGKGKLFCVFLIFVSFNSLNSWVLSSDVSILCNQLRDSCNGVLNEFMYEKKDPYDVCSGFDIYSYAPEAFKSTRYLKCIEKNGPKITGKNYLSNYLKNNINNNNNTNIFNHINLWYVDFYMRQNYVEEDKETIESALSLMGFYKRKIRKLFANGLDEFYECKAEACDSSTKDFDNYLWFKKHGCICRSPLEMKSNILESSLKRYIENHNDRTSLKMHKDPDGRIKFKDSTICIEDMFKYFVDRDVTVQIPESKDVIASRSKILTSTVYHKGGYKGVQKWFSDHVLEVKQNENLELL